jgi:hypothetical protein
MTIRCRSRFERQHICWPVNSHASCWTRDRNAQHATTVPCSASILPPISSTWLLMLWFVVITTLEQI